MTSVTRVQKILIIEGNGALGENIAKTLKKDGYENVTVLKNGVDAMKGIEDNLPHLILLDINLPGADGYDILAKKMAEPLLAKIPVFLLSADGMPINMRRVPQGSVAEFLMALHLEPNDVLDKINRYFGNERLAPESSGAGTGSKKKLLWVEDDKLIGTILSRKLISSGFDIFHAKSGDEALEALKESKPDVIALDLVLPGMSGFEILQNIRANENLKNVPVIILSNLSKQSDIERAKTLGAQKFVVKAAASLDQIVAEIRALCK